jgi:7-cyano-7-deazaguanine synthase in queuosine biosynthesis
MNKLVYAPRGYKFAEASDELQVVLFGHNDIPTQGCSGDKIWNKIRTSHLQPSSRAWDFLSIAISVIAADFAGKRNDSPDGWTREFDLQIAVADPIFWNSQGRLIEKLLGFLSTDRWSIRFLNGGFTQPTIKELVEPTEDCVMLLSGGLDSLVGCIDLKERGLRPYCVSQTMRGEGANQINFPQSVGGFNQLPLNHATNLPFKAENSQRARSFVFLAYGVLLASALKRYREGEFVTLYVCENGYISINPALTEGRLGSHSTRTTHPVFLKLVQQLIDQADLKVRIENPYQHKTKGELMRECKNQSILNLHASRSISCGRYQHFNLTHCGRCVPCLVRRAAFRSAGLNDSTIYKYEELGRDDEHHARFDDVRAVGIANLEVKSQGLQRWIGPALSTSLLGDTSLLEATVGRGLSELGALLSYYGIK